MATQYSTFLSQVAAPSSPTTGATFQARLFGETGTPDAEQPEYQSVNSPIFSSPVSVQAKLTVGAPGDPYEQEADRIADQVMAMPDPNAAQVQRIGSSEDEELQMKPLGASIQRLASPEEDELQMQSLNPSAQQASPDLEPRLGQSKGGGAALADSARAFIEPRMGFDFGNVRVHTDSAAVQMNQQLGARAFTHGQDIYFGAGEYNPSSDDGKRLLSHELTHVVQQTGVINAKAINPGITPVSSSLIQRNLTGSFPVTHGIFEMDMQTREGATNTPPTHSGLDGYIRFVPKAEDTTPNSNSIAMVQIVKLTDLGKPDSDVNPASMPAAQAPRGALGGPGLRTEDDAARGVEGGFFTDIHHRPNAGSPGVPQGSARSPRYNFQPAAPGTTGTVGQTTQPAQYGGGTGGVVGQTPGFKRSSDLADIRSASLYDTPGVADPSWKLDFKFESVARGEDTMFTYGSVEWGFRLNAGKVENETMAVQDGPSATFGEALERHRDFYVHEPVTFYFDFNGDTLNTTEVAKIDAFLDYLNRPQNQDVEMNLEGFADLRGGAGAYNTALAQRRAEAVSAALIAKGVDAARIQGITVSPGGASTSATSDAGTGDQGGDPVLGADQDREANRWANRRVVLTFQHPFTPAPPAPGGGTP